MAVSGLIFFVVASLGYALIGGRVARFAAGFPVVFVLACGAQIIAGQAVIKRLGLEYVIFALIIGLLLNHAMLLPDWLREAVRTEYYIKTGLVILGAGILFKEILQAGWLGLAQALLVVSVVWYFAFWVSRRLRVDDEFGAMLATAVSICGVSAAIAACGAIHESDAHSSSVEIPNVHSAGVQVDDCFDDGEAEAGSLSGRFSGKEGLENLHQFLLGNSFTAIIDFGNDESLSHAK